MQKILVFFIPNIWKDCKHQKIWTQWKECLKHKIKHEYCQNDLCSEQSHANRNSSEQYMDILMRAMQENWLWTGKLSLPHCSDCIDLHLPQSWVGQPLYDCSGAETLGLVEVLSLDHLLTHPVPSPRIRASGNSYQCLNSYIYMCILEGKV